MQTNLEAAPLGVTLHTMMATLNLFLSYLFFLVVLPGLGVSGFAYGLLVEQLYLRLDVFLFEPEGSFVSVRVSGCCSPDSLPRPLPVVG